MSRATHARRIVAAALYGGGGLGALSAAMYGVLYGESKLARRRIAPPRAPAPAVDGIWHGLDPDATTVRAPLRMAMIGDSSAAGVGVVTNAHTPGALLALGLSDRAQRPVELLSTAFIGARSSDLPAQVVKALDAVAPQKLDIAVIMIGANDVTHRVRPADSIRDLTAAVRTLRAAGSQVVVATCPDLGTIRPIAQPLRYIARRWSRALAAAQTIAVVEADGRTVSLGNLLGPSFAAQRHWFSEDGFHPSEHGYAAAAEVMLPSVLASLQLPTGTEPATRFTSRRARPIANAAARAAGHPGTEVARAEVDGRQFGDRGRWARLLRRQASTEPG
jgi:lysophospholipase L1-like esterase